MSVMLDTDPSFRPVRAREGYPPLEHLGLIGDVATVALVGLEGNIHWRVVAPVLSAWSKDLVPLQEYPAGSEGPGSWPHHGAD